MIAWWPGEGNGSNLVSGVTATGGAFVPGIVGQAFAFNGNAYVTAEGDQTLSPPSVTMEGWFKIESILSAGSSLVSHIPVTSDAGWNVIITPERQLRFSLLRGATIGAVTSTGTVASAWTHIAATYDGTSAKIFINGALQADAPFPGGYTPTTVPMLIGGASWCESYGCSGFNFHLVGLVDELSIYDRSLTAAEIEAIYNAGSKGKCQEAPFIRKQPLSQFVLPGANATFTVDAGGSMPLFYQWYFNVTNVISGQTGASLTLGDVSESQVGTYSVVVSNSTASIVSSSAYLIIDNLADDDQDGLPSSWERSYGLNANDPEDATNHPAGDQLTYLQKYLYRLNPLTTDMDGDGVNDYEEIFINHSSPTNAFTAGDGIPDAWKVQYGLNPWMANATDEISSSGVNYLQVYRYNLAHTNQLDPRKPFFAPGTSIYEALNDGQGTNRMYYDRNDRLVGVEYSRGISLACVYDGNGNLVRQTGLSRANETNGLPVLWRFLNSLTNNTSSYSDSDGDGWSDFQEWKAGSSPTSGLSTPSLLGNPGRNISSLALPFTPSNFVVGVGQLDGLGGEEIVIGADGNPGADVNSLLVLTRVGENWSTQKVDVGQFGVTSIAVGQPSKRPGAGVYVGLRGPSNGSGRIVEFTSNGGIWQSAVVATSTNNAGFVAGVSDSALLGTVATSDSPEGALFSFLFNETNGWHMSHVGTNTSHRGLPVIDKVADQVWMLRLLGDDGGGIGLQSEFGGTSDNLALTGVATQSSSAGAGYEAGLAIDGNLDTYTVTYPYTDPTPSWLLDLGRVPWLDSIELYNRDGSEQEYKRLVNYEVSVFGPAGVDTTPVFKKVYENGPKPPAFQIIQLDGVAARFIQVKLLPPLLPDGGYLSLAEIKVLGRGLLTIAEPDTQNRLLWRGTSLAGGGGRLTPTSSFSVYYAFADDKNGNNLIDSADDFVTSEFLVSGTSSSLLTLSRNTIGFPTPAQSYGVASVNLLNRSNEVFFTGEPDGQVFAWTGTGTTSPLQRQLFSAHHIGKAWHVMAAAKTVTAEEALIGLRVNPGNPNQCDLIFWDPQPELPELASLRNTSPAAVVVPSSTPLSSVADVTVRMWDVEGNAATPFVQYRFVNSTNWQAATIVAVDGAIYSTNMPVSALPTGADHVVRWNVTRDLGSGVTNVLLRARADDFLLAGNWSLPTPFRINVGIPTDGDGDGMPDTWEARFFGNTSRTGLDDFDEDGFSDLAEFHAGTLPNDESSKLVLSISLVGDSVRIGWQTGTNVTHVLQRTIALEGEAWTNLLTNSPSLTPGTGSFTDALGTTEAFYRIQAHSE